jgi:hypothetical protein
MPRAVRARRREKSLLARQRKRSTSVVGARSMQMWGWLAIDSSAIDTEWAKNLCVGCSGHWWLANGRRAGLGRSAPAVHNSSPVQADYSGCTTASFLRAQTPANPWTRETLRHQVPRRHGTSTPRPRRICAALMRRVGALRGSACDEEGRQPMAHATQRMLKTRAGSTLDSRTRQRRQNRAVADGGPLRSAALWCHRIHRITTARNDHSRATRAKDLPSLSTTFNVCLELRRRRTNPRNHKLRFPGCFFSAHRDPCPKEHANPVPVATITADRRLVRWVPVGVPYFFGTLETVSFRHITTSSARIRRECISRG